MDYAGRMKNTVLAITRNPSIPLRLRKKIGKWLHVERGMAFATPLYGCIYHGLTGSHLDNKTYLYGMHESATIAFMRDVLARARANGRRPVYMDIGTNTGEHILGVAGLCDEIHGFEPWPPVYDRALANIRANNLSHVRLHPFGLGPQNARLPFTPPEATNHGIGTFLHGDGSTTLPIRRGDDVADELAVTPTLIKVDVEGFEPGVFEGLAQTIRRARPTIVFELSSENRARLEENGAFERFFGPGYRIMGLKPSRQNPVLVPFHTGGRYENLVALPDELPARP